MDSIYYRPQVNASYGAQQTALFGPDSISATNNYGGTQQSATLLGINAPLGLSWAGYAGGISGMASAYGQMGANGYMLAGGMSMPGSMAMGMIASTGMTSGMYASSGLTANSRTTALGTIDNTMEVAGTGMGADKTYKMYPGEALAVASVIKGDDDQSLSIEDMQSNLEEKYGIETELKTVDGVKTLVNKSTGNTVIADGNGNNVMDSGDMKLDEALTDIEDKYGISLDDFESRYDLTQGGVGSTTGQNTYLGSRGLGAAYSNTLGLSGLGMSSGLSGMGMYSGMSGLGMYSGMGMSSGLSGLSGLGMYSGLSGSGMYGSLGGISAGLYGNGNSMYASLGMSSGLGGYGTTGLSSGLYGTSLYGSSGAQSLSYGLWGDPLWQDTIYGLTSSALQYAQLYGSYGTSMGAYASF